MRINIKEDSRQIELGDIFVAIKGINTDGHDYIDAAIKNGASKIVANRGSYDVETEIVPNTKEYLINYLDTYYGKKFDKMKIIGVTGTSGKTTSCFLIYDMLKKLGRKVAYIGTLGFYVNDKIVALNNTTPGIVELYEMFLECALLDTEIIVMEVSSHALELDRCGKILFDIGVFTNLSQDHLDFHKDMTSYSLAKQKLFSKLKNKKDAIINIDDTYYKAFVKENNNNTFFGMNDLADYQILDYKLLIGKTTFTLRNNLKNKSYEISLKIPGKYNIYNYLVAFITLHKLGFLEDDILKLIDNLAMPPGRMEGIGYKDNVIIVDYAHKPDAVKNILESVSEYKENKVITVIGCGGNRDRTKRPFMGSLATKLSDYVVFTNDNPRTEDEKEIMKDITAGLIATNFEVIYDRKLAIEKGISMLSNKDMLLILGKGHENYQIIGTEKKHFDDLEIVKNYVGGNNGN